MIQYDKHLFKGMKIKVSTTSMLQQQNMIQYYKILS